MPFYAILFTMEVPVPPLESDERIEALQGIAGAIRAHLDNKTSGETIDNQEQRFDPEHSVHGLMFKEAQDFRYYFLPSPDGSYAFGKWIFANNPDTSVVDFADSLRTKHANAAFKSKWGDRLYHPDGVPMEGFRIEREYSALSYARKVLAKSDEPIKRLFSVIIPADVAAYYKPQDWDGQKPRKHKNESNDEAIFRMAWNDLNQRARTGQVDTVNIKLFKALLKKDNYGNRKISDEDFDSAMHNPENQDLRDGQLSIQIENTATRLIKAIKNPNFTAERHREEAFELLRLSRQEKDPADNTEIPVKETDWTILPPGTLEELSEGNGTNKEVESFVDPDRMRWLARLAIDWGNDAYIAVSNLDKSGNYDYRVAVLPQLKNGILIEHAVAENPASGNAVYVFRGERGVEDNGHTWLTWKEVLSDTKKGARALGARKIVHNQFSEENVLEYLTRQQADLDKPGYKR